MSAIHWRVRLCPTIPIDPGQNRGGVIGEHVNLAAGEGGQGGNTTRRPQILG